MTTLVYARELAMLFATVEKAKVVRKLQVRTSNHRSCNSCGAQNYVGQYDTAKTMHTDRLYEIVVGNMCVCMCADCIEAMNDMLDEAMQQNGGARND